MRDTISNTFQVWYITLVNSIFIYFENSKKPHSIVPHTSGANLRCTVTHPITAFSWRVHLFFAFCFDVSFSFFLSILFTTIHNYIVPIANPHTFRHFNQPNSLKHTNLKVFHHLQT